MDFNDLKIGQVWVPHCKDDYSFEIVGLTNDMVEVKEIETGETYFHERNGPDGFVDLLEQVLYTLKI